MIDLFQTSNPTVVPGGDTLRVVDFLDDAERRIDRLDEQPEVRANLWSTLSAIHSARSRFDRARSATEQAIRAADEAGAPELQDRLRHEQARLATLLDGPSAARPALEASVARYRETSPGSAELAIALQDLAAATEDPERKGELLTESLRIRRARNEPMELAAALNALGSLHWGQRRTDLARTLFLETLEILETRLPPEHPHVLVVSNNLAHCELLLGRFDEALARHASILETRRRVLGERTVDVAASLNAVGQCLVHVGRHAEAVEHLARSEVLYRDLLGEDHPETFSVARNRIVAEAAAGSADAPARLDELADRAGRSAQAADSAPFYRVQAQRARLQRGLPPAAGRDDDLREVAARDDSVLQQAYALLVRGLIRRNEGRTGEALADLERARELRASALPPSHPEVAETLCALLTAGRLPEDRDPAREAIRTYETWGLRLPDLARRARNSLDF